MRNRQRIFAATLFTLIFLADYVGATERFYISIPGPTLSYVPLYYGQDKGFFAQEGLDLQVLVVRGIVGVSSLMSGKSTSPVMRGAVSRPLCAACRSKLFPSPAIGRSTS